MLEPGLSRAPGPRPQTLGWTAVSLWAEVTERDPHTAHVATAPATILGTSALLAPLLALSALHSPRALTLFLGESVRTGSSAARAMLLRAITTRMTISKYRMVTM